MKVMVTGATGFLGRWLTERLISRGDSVRVLGRATTDWSALGTLPVERIEGDVTDPAAVARAVEGAQVVFHLAGIRRAPARQQFMDVNAGATRVVCEAMAKAGARRLVLCSSLAAVGPSSLERPALESDPLRPAEWYGESKAEAERIALSFNGQGPGKLEVTIARPSRIIGPGDKENLTFFRIAKRGVRVRLAGKPRPISMVDVEDVVDHLLLLAERPEAVGEAFFIAGPDTATLAQMLDEAGAFLGVRLRTVYLPGVVLHGMAAVADAVSKVTGKHLALNRKLARQLLVPAWTCSIEKSERLLGYRPQRGFADSIKRSATWYQRHRWI